MREAFRDSTGLRLSVREWLITSAGAARDGRWHTAGAALVYAAMGIRWRVSFLGEIHAGVWTIAILATTAGCEVALDSSGAIAGTFMSSLAAFAYAVRTKATSDARVQRAILKTLGARDQEVAQFRLLYEAALGRERIAVDRLVALNEEFDNWRSEYGMQRTPHTHSRKGDPT